MTPPWNLVEVLIEPEIEPGAYRVGGVRILSDPTDEEMGRALRTKQVRVHSETEAKKVRRIVRENPTLELV